MIYLLYGDQYPTLKKELRKLKEKILGKEYDDFSYVSLSCKEVTVQDIVSEASKPALFSPKKLIVASDPYFITTSKERVEIEKNQNYDVLKKYIQNQSQYCDIVFFLEGSNISSRNEIFKLISKHGQVKQIEQLSQAQLALVADQYFKKNGVVIDQDALNELLLRVGLDLAKFVMEANKLCLYKEHITLEDVEIMVSLKLEQNAFAIAENLMKGDTKKALKIYYDLRVLKEEPVRLIALMASQFRIVTQIGHLLNQGYSKDEISKILGIHPYRVQLGLINLSYLPYHKAMYVLDKLYELDYKIKSGNIDPYYGFELFILNFAEYKK